MQADNSHFNDISIGKKIRYRRKSMEISQTELGEKLGVSFQQIQKYENGSNRVGAGRLQEIANILNVNISFFIPIFHHTLIMKDFIVKKNTSF
ncbi:hypothetical protein BVwin_05850 [Bartonella vinsonii subsp. berkhoffii str. Winnie]|nr:hypothetical protein BVwin_05850 [Bartonella vinsonii subsp. berkhoffii str. Winnie]